jgi:hypothetical protein
MGYTIKIGQANLEPQDPDDYDGQLVARYSVELVRHENAPASGDPTDYENQRWPSYSGWSDFAHEVGLYEIFYDRDRGLLREHPGCFKLEEAHHIEVESAIRIRRASNGRFQPTITDSQDYEMQRLLWLEYWIRWALDNCDLPAMENS